MQDISLPTNEGKMDRSERFREILNWFEEHMPVAETELDYRTPYELLVAVILSAQCTDKRVNMITPRFFEQFPVPELLARASFDDVFACIRSCSYPNNKAKHLIGMASVLCDEFDGVVPSDVEKLQKLPGGGQAALSAGVRSPPWPRRWRRAPFSRW
jgi:endonuclease-3